MKVSTLRTVRAVAWATALVLAAALVWLVVLNKPGEVGGDMLAARIGGPFALVDQTGATVTEAALKGHPSALFFGYTFCPDVCPMTLSDMTAWLMDLGAEGDKLKVYFITVDPERDTEQQMAEYLQAFDPRIIGLTGSRPAIDQIIKEYRVYARKVPGEEGAYSMDHTAAVYLLDSEANFVGTVDYQEDHDTALAKLKRLIERS
jgi:protein SCO1/2